MTPQETLQVRPRRGLIYGVTHNIDGTAIQRRIRSLKVGIGVPQGPDIHAYMRHDGTWMIDAGQNGSKERLKIPLATRQEAEAKYRDLWRSVPERKFPAKLPHFTFLEPNGEGGFRHDFDAIEAHGPAPTEIDVFFTSEDSVTASMEWWTSSKLQCWGDGVNAMRRVELAKGDEAKLAKDAQTQGEKMFPIIQGCAAHGCQYQQPDDKGNRLCKPHLRACFQLINSPVIGSTATFDTTGFRSTQQIVSSLMDIRTQTGNGDPATGRVAGIPLKFVLTPYFAYPNGRKTKLFGAHFEFRPEGRANAAGIAEAMIRHTYSYQGRAAVGGGSQPQIEAPAVVIDEVSEEIEATEFTSEFTEGSHESAEQVGIRKLEELRKRGAVIQEVGEEPDPDLSQKETTEAGNPFRGEDSDLPNVLNGINELPHITKIRKMELTLKLGGKGSEFGRILEKHGESVVDKIPVEKADAVVADIEAALAGGKTTRLKL